MFSFEIVFWGLLLGSLIYLLIRRIKISEKEDFEDRDN